MPTEPMVTIGGVTFTAEVAHTLDGRARGLSGRDHLAPGTGMLFVFEGGPVSSFWMKGMRFAIDFVWISAHCEVAGVTTDAPPPEPGAPDSSLLSYEPPAPAAYTFEINAGEVAQHGIEPGDPVSFSGVSAQGANC